MRVKRQADAAGADQADLADLGPVLRQALLQALVGGPDLRTVVEQRTARGGELQLAWAADQQRPQPFFETLYMLADGGLGEVKTLGSAGKAALRGERLEGAQPLRTKHNENLSK